VLRLRVCGGIGAFGLALACDLVVASDAATFGTPEINAGVVAAFFDGREPLWTGR
jgi:enoyl-CoA hydratase/carnithine racemase